MTPEATAFLENAIRIQLMLQAFYHLVDSSPEKKITLPFTVMTQGSQMGGVFYEVDEASETVSFSAVSQEQALAYAQAQNMEKH